MKLRRWFCKQLILFTIICWIGLWVSKAMAAPSDPLQIVQATSDQMLTALKENKASLKQNPDLVSTLVHKILLPHVDLEGMARRALGRDAWQQATNLQRAKFVDAFTTLLINTYASALVAYDDQKMQFMPIRDGVKDQRVVQIDSQIIQPDGPPISVSYRLALRQDDWKVIDFSVEGVSLLTSFQQQFADELAQNGMDALLEKMTQHNQKLQQSSGNKKT